MEKHHVLPLSLWGMEIAENKVAIEKHVHSHIHAVLNIPHRKVRDLRTLQNDLDAPYEEVVRKEAELMRAYLGNIHKLPPELVTLHLNSMVGQIQRLKYEIKLRTIALLDKRNP